MNQVTQPSQCRLCLRSTTLRNSHLVPEFFFDQLYDTKHRYYGVTNTRGDRVRLFQKGMREKLLCGDCENQLSRYEHHARSVLYGGTEICVEDLGRGVRVLGIDYRRFKLFLMSLLWRLAITSLPYWSGIELGQRHREKLRTMLLAEDAGEPWQYGCTVIGLLHEGKAFKDFISSPAEGKNQGHRVWAWAIGGFVFSFFVSSHKPDFIVEGFVQKNGQLLILREEFTKIPFLVEMGSEIAAAMGGKPLPSIKT